MNAAGAADTHLITAEDGHQFGILAIPADRAHPLMGSVLLIPALGIAARHYLPFAEALAADGYHVAIHECRGHGSSNLRASRQCNWGFNELLLQDLPASLDWLNHQGRPATILCGHSLGGQLACCLAAITKNIEQLWLIGSGSPHWRNFPRPLRWGLPIIYFALPLFARTCGFLPGKQIGFGGREARSLIGDWGRVGRNGDYRQPSDVEARMAVWSGTIIAITLENDWLAPPSSMTALTTKMPLANTQPWAVAADTNDPDADHYSWMKCPESVTTALLSIAKKISQNR